MVKTVSQSEYARQRGVTPGYINKLVKQGVLKLQEGKLDPEQADKDIQDYAAGLKGTPGPKATGQPDDDSLASWRRKELMAKTALKQLQLDEERGLLINAEELKIGLCQLFADVKTIIRAIPHKTAQEVFYIARATTSDRQGIASISTLLLKEVDEALTELSRWQPKSNKKGGGTGKKIGPYKRR